MKELVDSLNDDDKYVFDDDILKAIGKDEEFKTKRDT
jgi:hypothetical protein